MKIHHVGDGWTQKLRAPADMMLTEFVTEFCWRCPPSWEQFNVTVHSREGCTVGAHYSRVRDEIKAWIMPPPGG